MERLSNQGSTSGAGDNELNLLITKDVAYMLETMILLDL